MSSGLSRSAPLFDQLLYCSARHSHGFHVGLYVGEF